MSVVVIAVVHTSLMNVSPPIWPVAAFFKRLFFFHLFFLWPLYAKTTWLQMGMCVHHKKCVLLSNVITLVVWMKTVFFFFFSFFNNVILYTHTRVKHPIDVQLGWLQKARAFYLHNPLYFYTNHLVIPHALWMGVLSSWKRSFLPGQKCFIKR